MADGAYREIKKALDRIEGKTDDVSKVIGEHTTELAVIKQQVLVTNGTVKANCADIIDIKSNQDRFTGSLNSWKYMSVILGILLSVMTLFAYLKP